MRVIPIFTFDEFEAVEATWMSPLALSSLKDFPTYQYCCARQVGPKRPLKNILARLAWPTMTEAAVRRLAAHLELDHPPGIEFVELLVLLMEQCAPGIKPEEIAEALQRRTTFVASSEAVAILTSECSEAFGKDADQIQSWAKEEQSNHESNEMFHKGVKKYVEKKGVQPRRAAVQERLPVQPREAAGRASHRLTITVSSTLTLQ